MSISDEEIRLIQDKRDQMLHDFWKHILLMASGLLGILVSLHKADKENTFSRVLFPTTIGLLALGIALLTIRLHQQVDLHKKLWAHTVSEVEKEQKNPLYHSPNHVLRPGRIYEVLEKIGYISFFLAVVCLTLYAISIA